MAVMMFVMMWRITTTMAMMNVYEDDVNICFSGDTLNL